uniref:Uncharacterized protein n=1 Tax=Trichobilharzia regenti TaxID=157069 RepID=A0AA85J3V5_TRIRE
TWNPIVKNYLCRLVQCKRRSEVISRLDVSVSQYIQRRWMSRRELWAAAFRDHAPTFDNATNNRVETSHKQMKRYLQRSVWIYSRIQQESMIARLRCFTYSCSKRLMPILRLLTPNASRKVMRDYEKQ